MKLEVRMSNSQEKRVIRRQVAFVVALCASVVLLAAPRVAQANQYELLDQTPASNPKSSLAVIENPELAARVLENLLRSIIFSTIETSSSQSYTQKRGLDLGISRGFSGSQAGKHLMGLSAASFANGPGR